MVVNPRNFFDPRTANPQGVGGFDPLAVKGAAGDQRMGFDMLMQYLTGSTDTGTGPFAGFLESTLAPLATSAINAIAAGNGGQLPTNVDDLFSGIADRIGGGAQGNIYDYLGGLAQKAIGAKLGPGANISYDELQALLQSLNPLTTMGMDRITGSQFQRQQGDLLRSGQTPGYWNMTGPNSVNNKKDWGDFFTQSPFFKQYYGGAPTGAGGPPSMSSVVANSAGNRGGGLDDTTRYRLAGQAGASGGGGGGMYNP